jgi:Domain of unknown function (DUF397)
VSDDDQANLAWRKSSACWDANCVEVAANTGNVLIRSTRDAENTTLIITPQGWAIFIAQMRDNMG